TTHERKARVSHKGFSHIGLSTLDLDKTRDFYEGVLKFNGASLETRTRSPSLAAEPDESTPARTARAGALPSGGRRRRARSPAPSRAGPRPVSPAGRRRSRA